MLLPSTPFYYTDKERNRKEVEMEDGIWWQNRSDSDDLNDFMSQKKFLCKMEDGERTDSMRLRDLKFQKE